MGEHCTQFPWNLGKMTKTVETALRLNILTLYTFSRENHTSALSLQWSCGTTIKNGIALLADDELIVAANGKVYRTQVVTREFRKGRYLPYIQCLTCAKKCHILFLEGGTLLCRRCAWLMYECQRSDATNRAYSMAAKLTERLKGELGQAIPPRPKGMWHTTYCRLTARLIAAKSTYYTGLLARRRGQDDTF